MNAFNDPLIFIKGPPVFHLPPKERFEAPYELLDESTSIYEIQKSYSTKTLAIIDKLNFLAKPFQRKVYRPLIFHLRMEYRCRVRLRKLRKIQLFYL